MGKAVGQRGRHLASPKTTAHSLKLKLVSDDDAGALIEFAQQIEQECSARGAELQVAEFVKDDEIDVD